MIIKKVTLNNIRSYENAEICIPEGSVLLSGDIGSGKSSVLLAIEFALFGLQPGQRGSSLLRNGKDEGFVKLEMCVGEKNVALERGLKKGKSVTQSYATLSINNDKKDISVGELKNFVLNILNYPAEFAKKTNLLYKFTVYTPQEEMKQIILEKADTRLDTLRHVFGIDKYKRIGENLAVVLAELREGARNKEGIIRDLELQKEKKASKESDVDKAVKEEKETEEKLMRISEERKKQEQEIKGVEEKIEHKKRYEQEIEKAKIAISGKRDQTARLERGINEIESAFRDASGRFNREELDNSLRLLSEKRAQVEALQKEYIELFSRIKSLEIKKSEYKDSENKISRMIVCPTCLQDVSERHKTNIRLKIEHEITEIEKALAELLPKKKSNEKNAQAAKDDASRAERKKSELEMLKTRIESLGYDKVGEMKKELEMLKADIVLLESQILTLKNSAFELSRFERVYEQKKNELESTKGREKAAEISRAELKKESEMLLREISELEKEISRKEQVKKELAYMNELVGWLSGNFTSMIQFTERNIMIRLREEFSEIFNKWFSVLVSETLRARLDEDFTPVIEQQGFEIDYAYLSGGERTAVALAYRLALNQVINSLLSRIKTKDIVILDEPTDGFSEQQLDKMRDVLQQLKVGQLILVSHEAKIESFVDKIIKFRKEDGVTRVEG
ncbi:AAA family ATPase [Candidatus Pacearchaeota archaeon]|nr:AAA family ATPase [Candidatus Pacearchaeota archaeon]